MKVTRAQWLFVTAACLIVASSMAQSGDRPPGADGNNWVPISDVAGILLTNPVGSPGAMRLQLQGFNVDTIVPAQGIGVLMVKHGGTWMRVELELPRARVQPLN